MACGIQDEPCFCSKQELSLKPSLSSESCKIFPFYSTTSFCLCYKCAILVQLNHSICFCVWCHGKWTCPGPPHTYTDILFVLGMAHYVGRCILLRYTVEIYSPVWTNKDSQCCNTNPSNRFSLQEWSHSLTKAMLRAAGKVYVRGSQSPRLLQSLWQLH